MNSTILSTKLLTPAQKELILNGKLRLVEYDAIRIESLRFEPETDYDCAIFTSQNAVYSYMKRLKANSTAIPNLSTKAVCVGDKTKATLQTFGFEVLAFAPNAQALAEVILKKYRNFSFVFYSGNLRRDTLPTVLQKEAIRFKEVQVYQTEYNHKKFRTTFDGILFFSPSGVQSFTKKNDMVNSTAFCIGPTTLNETKKYTQRLVQANKPTIENVIVQAVKHYN